MLYLTCPDKHPCEQGEEDLRWGLFESCVKRGSEDPHPRVGSRPMGRGRGTVGNHLTEPVIKKRLLSEFQMSNLLLTKLDSTMDCFTSPKQFREIASFHPEKC